MSNVAITIRAHGQIGLRQIMKWVDQQKLAGARMFVAEGLPRAGKSTLVKHALSEGLQALDLDDLLGGNVPENEKWTDRVIAGGAKDRLACLAAGGPFLVGGASAFEVAERVTLQLDPLLVRRIYLKEMATRGGEIYWSEGDFIAKETHNPQTFLGSVRNRHATTMPWLQADLIFERLPDDA